MELHVVGITRNGRLFHTIRDVNRPAPQNPWDPWEDIMASAGDPGSPFVIIDCAGVNGQLHICGITDDNKLLHTIRFGPGNWQGWGDVRGVAGNPLHEYRHVGLAEVNGELHVCVTIRDIADWRILHAIRHETSWDSLQYVDASPAGRPGSFNYNVDCALVSGDLHVCGITGDGKLWHTIRFTQALDWQPFGDVKATQSNDIGNYLRYVGTAGIAGSLHVCVQANGDLWHTIRIDNFSWQASFGNVREVVEETRPRTFGNVSCANVDGDLHVCSVTEAGSILHTIRFSNPPDWQRPFGDVTEVVGGLGIIPGTFNLVSVAGL